MSMSKRPEGIGSTGCGGCHTICVTQWLPYAASLRRSCFQWVHLIRFPFYNPALLISKHVHCKSTSAILIILLIQPLDRPSLPITIRTWTVLRKVDDAYATDQQPDLRLLHWIWAGRITMMQIRDISIYARDQDLSQSFIATWRVLFVITSKSQRSNYNAPLGLELCFLILFVSRYI